MHQHKATPETFLPPYGDALRHAERALQECEERFHLAIDASQDTIYDYDVERDTLTWISRSHDLLGLAAHEMPRRLSDWMARLHPDDVRHASDVLRAALAEHGPYRAEYRVQSATGSYVDVLDRGRVVRGGGGDGVAIRAVGALMDVTDLKQAERLKAELVATVSHELRTPLTSIVGFSELMLEREFPPDDRRQFLQLVHTAALRLSGLITDFLDLQQFESGQLAIRPIPVDLDSLVQRTLLAMGDDPAHPCSVELAPALPRARVDPRRFQQILSSLLSNARKYSPAGGAIRVDARVEDGMIVVAVADHGLGIAPEDLPHIFERFYRSDHTDRRSIGGAGLGLAIARQFVEAQGGRIWAESDGLGRGSVVSFTVPVAAA